MRSPSIFNGRRGDLEIKMTPMIDVVFLLLVFFVWTASFQIVEHILPSNMTAAAGTEAVDADEPPPPDADFDDVVVRIVSRNGIPVWMVNKIELSNLTRVRERLDMIAQLKRDAPVILHPDPDIMIGDVIDVYDLAILVGFEKVQFAASERI